MRSLIHCILELRSNPAVRQLRPHGARNLHSCRAGKMSNSSKIDGHNKKHLKNVGPIRHYEPFYIAIHQVSHRCPRQRRQRQRVTEGTAMAP